MSLKKKIVHAAVLSCRKASELIDKRSVTALTWKQLTQLKWHTSICDGCVTYMKQSTFLDEVLMDQIKKMHEDVNKTSLTNDELKKKIISGL